MATTMQKVSCLQRIVSTASVGAALAWRACYAAPRQVPPPKSVDYLCRPALSLRYAIFDLLQRSRVIHRRQVTGVAAFTNRLDGAA